MLRRARRPPWQPPDLLGKLPSTGLNVSLGKASGQGIRVRPGQKCGMQHLEADGSTSSTFLQVGSGVLTLLQLPERVF